MQKYNYTIREDYYLLNCRSKIVAVLVLIQDVNDVVNISFEYVVRKGKGRNVWIVDGSEKPIGKFTTRFIQLFPSVEENILAEQ
ncbi:hypothetical protein L1283_001811 [Sphingobacterium sp. HSC-15S19]